MNKLKYEFKLEFPFGLPPVLPDVEQQLKEYIVCPEKLPIHQFQNNQLAWDRKPNVENLFNYEPFPSNTTLKVERDLKTGGIIGYVEVPIEGAGLTAKNSFSLKRAPLPADDNVRGSAENFPFWPGGFPEIETVSDTTTLETDLLTLPPGFDRSFNFDRCDYDSSNSVKSEEKVSEDVNEFMRSNSDIIDLCSILRPDMDFDWLNETKNEINKKDKELDESLLESRIEQISSDIEKLLSLSEDKIPILKINEPGNKIKTTSRLTEWAEIIDTDAPVNDFEQKIPIMAHEYPFELDPFQKQAILHLERHEHVFVAAHTSAGKTVVAEYAIALSRKNMTRAIYTSPVKALSNQKYRDFRETFGDVGLITGDFQLNQTASCLVMTTEILRSMLYGGSEVIRDLQYAIFDEVHYVNDAERGHVWEEVLIMLPQHVVIVMLSATVPNTLQFADWVGRTKKRKVYVMSTPKRPVPLEHSLYMGFNPSNTDKQFTILDTNGSFLSHNIKNAALSLQKKEPPAAARGRGRGDSRGGRGGGGGRSGGPLSFGQQKTLWLNLINDLNKKKKLPTVAFTLSRKRCDGNAELVMSVDLLCAVEKSHVHKFVQKCLQSLKEEDRVLPQVMKMQMLLERGIGVHHSGILPILKEIVELLFQDGYVKFLFATETFAMGVNMPAKTVVFDSIKKFDGLESRVLKPAEYIQMAGRAGRRGLDEMGTVLILCANEPPPEIDLRCMMLGTPTLLSSQFRLTYAVMLILLRVKKISVEGMMKQSFREIEHKKRSDQLKIQLDKITDDLENTKEPSGDLVPQLTKFYQAANKWINSWISNANTLIKLPGPMKELQVGRLILLSTNGYIGKLGLILKVENKNRGNIVLTVLTYQDNLIIEDSSLNKNWYKMLSIIQKISNIDNWKDTIITINAEDIWYLVLGVTVKIEAEKVYKDWEKRQLERFREDPPWPAFVFAVQELRRITQSEDLKFHSILTNQKLERNIPDVEYIDLADTILQQRIQAESILSDINITNFEEQFKNVFQYEELKSNKERITYLLSDKSLLMFAEYENRLEVLKRLDYIDSNKVVQFKGRVACIMGQHELLITEMILSGELHDLNPAEISAIFSGLVFEQKRSKKDDELDDQENDGLTSSLRKAIKKMEEIAITLVTVQRECGVTQDEAENYEEKLNFDLAEVVYQWALGKPFAEIMEMTEVQEGIIVRVIVQLGELLRNIKDAAKLIGDVALQTKMEAADNAIKRNIVFAASLYTQ